MDKFADEIINELHTHTSQRTLNRRTVSSAVSSVGGTVTGLAIASGFASQRKDCTVPNWHSVGIGNFDSSISERDAVAMSAQSKYSNRLTVKFSGTNESFSHHAARGRDSSAQRRSYSFDPDFGAKVVASAMNMPSGTVSIIFQELANISVPGVLINADIQGSTTSIEAIASGGRMLLIYSKGTLAYHEVSGAYPPHLFPPTQWKLLVLLLADLDESLDELGEEWNVEGFWEKSSASLHIFQLRPTPKDRPCDSVSFNIPDNENAARWTTRFVWGAFNRIVPSNMDEWPNAGIYLKTERTRTIPDHVATALESDKNIILIDTTEGFRLSHEPWNLPSLMIRDKYNYVYIPVEILAAARQGETRLVSNGDIATLVPTN